MKRLLRTWVLLAAVAGVLAAVSTTVNPQARAMLWAGRLPDEITLAEARAWREPLLWVDARSDSEYARDHIPEALPLNDEHWDAQVAVLLQRWQPGTRVIVYCSQSGCSTSREVAARLRRDYRLDDVRALHGGWAAWQKALAP